MNDGNATNLAVGRPRPAGVLDSERLCFALPRDRLGYFEVVPDPRPNLLPSENTHQLYWREHIGDDMVPEYADPHCISYPIDLKGLRRRCTSTPRGCPRRTGSPWNCWTSACGRFPGTAGPTAFLLPTGCGRRSPWKGARSLEGIDSPVRVRINWECERSGDVFLYAAYVANDG